MVLGDSRQAHQRTQSLHFLSSFINHSTIACCSSAQTPSSLSNAWTVEHSTGSERGVGSTRRRGNHMHDHSRFQRDIEWHHRRLSLSLSLSFSLPLMLTKVIHAQYRKRFRASYNTEGSWVSMLVNMMWFNLVHAQRIGCNADLCALVGETVRHPPMHRHARIVSGSEEASYGYQSVASFFTRVAFSIEAGLASKDPCPAEVCMSTDSLCVSVAERWLPHIDGCWKELTFRLREHFQSLLL